MAHRRYLAALAMTGLAVDMPFADNTFERIVTGHCYSHRLGVTQFWWRLNGSRELGRAG